MTNNAVATRLEGPKHSLVNLHEISVFRSGWQPVYVMEHSHPEIQVSVRLPAPGKPSSSAPITWVAASHEPHGGLLDGNTEIVLCYFSPDYINRTAYDAFGKEQANVQGRERMDDPFLREIGAALLKELRYTPQPSRLYIEALTISIAGHLIREYTSAVFSTPQKERLRWQDWKTIRDYIHANLDGDLSLTQLASELSMSPYRFARLFRGACGSSPGQFILQCRLEEARRLLLRTELSIHQIALQTGFNSLSHFTQTFHKRVGVAPSAFRQK